MKAQISAPNAAHHLTGTTRRASATTGWAAAGGTLRPRGPATVAIARSPPSGSTQRPHSSPPSGPRSKGTTGGTTCPGGSASRPGRTICPSLPMYSEPSR